MPLVLIILMLFENLRNAGQVGYVYSGMKTTKEAQIGDTLHLHNKPVEVMTGFKPAKAMVSDNQE